MLGGEAEKLATEGFEFDAVISIGKLPSDGGDALGHVPDRARLAALLPLYGFEDGASTAAREAAIVEPVYHLVVVLRDLRGLGVLYGLYNLRV